MYFSVANAVATEAIRHAGAVKYGTSEVKT